MPLPPEIAAIEDLLTPSVSEKPSDGSLAGRPSGRVLGNVDIPGVTAAR
ncbi:MAG: hypothetical protein AAF761_08680 [Pseudomonadota bacterium]